MTTVDEHISEIESRYKLSVDNDACTCEFLNAEDTIPFLLAELKSTRALMSKFAWSDNRGEYIEMASAEDAQSLSPGRTLLEVFDRQQEVK